MEQVNGNQFSATQIGMASMGCLNAEGLKQCPKYDNCCTAAHAMTCMGKALADFPEAKAEVLLAGLAVVSRSAKNIIEIRKVIPRMEMAVQVAA
ncbi:hypothetical protein [Ralstonia pseudosolanacearum]|uniref:hypothetical protein n=1 Tax=Ralstonia pseudosolanacearum TaxID=1310165 RepID=UPI003CE8B013